LTFPPQPPWTRRLAQRFVSLWLLKAVGTSAFMVLFFHAYFWVLSNPSRAPWVVPLLPPDHWVPFEPLALYAYGWLWVYVSVAPGLIGRWLALARYGIWAALMCALCLLIFWLWPTQTPSFAIDWSVHPQLAFLKGIDAAANACPSLHVAAALHAACWMHRQLRELGTPDWTRWLSWLQCVAIVWSTMAIRQHVFIDVIAGAAVGLLFAWLSMRWERPATAGAAVPAAR
jgi:membrane-associated phospholipid phosphatase